MNSFKARNQKKAIRVDLEVHSVHRVDHAEAELRYYPQKTLDGKEIYVCRQADSMGTSGKYYYKFYNGVFTHPEKESITSEQLEELREVILDLINIYQVPTLKESCASVIPPNGDVSSFSKLMWENLEQIPDLYEFSKIASKKIRIRRKTFERQAIEDEKDSYNGETLKITITLPGDPLIIISSKNSTDPDMLPWKIDIIPKKNQKRKHSNGEEMEENSQREEFDSDEEDFPTVASYQSHLEPEKECWYRLSYSTELSDMLNDLFGKKAHPLWFPFTLHDD